MLPAAGWCHCCCESHARQRNVPESAARGEPSAEPDFGCLRVLDRTTLIIAHLSSLGLDLAARMPWGTAHLSLHVCPFIMVCRTYVACRQMLPCQCQPSACTKRSCITPQVFSPGPMPESRVLQAKNEVNVLSALNHPNVVRYVY